MAERDGWAVLVFVSLRHHERMKFGSVAHARQRPVLRLYHLYVRYPSSRWTVRGLSPCLGNTVLCTEPPRHTRKSSEGTTRDTTLVVSRGWRRQQTRWTRSVVGLAARPSSKAHVAHVQLPWSDCVRTSSLRQQGRTLGARILLDEDGHRCGMPPMLGEQMARACAKGLPCG